MFQGLGASDGAFFSDMADDENGSMSTFCQVHQLQRALAYLADTARGGGQMIRKDGLNRVYDHQCWFQAADGLSDDVKLDGSQEIELFSGDIEPLGAHLHLLDRFFAGDVEHWTYIFCDSAGDL